MVGGSAGGGGDGGGGCGHRNRCLRAKAIFAGRIRSPASEAFAARATITAAVVCWWEWWEWRLLGGFAPSCDRGNGGEFSSRLRAPQLPPQLARA